METFSRSNIKEFRIICQLLHPRLPFPFPLPGLVCVSPGTDTYHPATVLAISATVAPLLHVGARNALLRATEIDDPLDVFATHLVPGVVGLGRMDAYSKFKEISYSMKYLIFSTKFSK